MSFKVVIPARFDSSRFPGKVLADINGKSMIQHVYEKALQSNAEEVIVATDSSNVVTEVVKFNGNVQLTAPSHTSGTERIAEVARNNCWCDDTIVVNVQGDSPLISPSSINQVAELRSSVNCGEIATLATPITESVDFYDSNVVKVVLSEQRNALYFSRAPIPHQSQNDSIDDVYRHLGIYCYDVNTLLSYVDFLPSPLEQLEKLEQLRALYYGFTVSVEVALEPHENDVDVPADIDKVKQILSSM